ncbi:hypothetical protein [Marinobacter sp. HL-58]|uniref:hypothetical protein n=1 Tax=Marinobacter sp. HL-58 TaxID=1479237 RepID=UPI000487A38C|nr:hypothetical protein [Marinobacter sp. HL-58]
MVKLKPYKKIRPLMKNVTKFLCMVGAVLLICLWLSDWGGDQYFENFSRFQGSFFIMHDILKYKMRYTLLLAGLFSFGADFLWDPSTFWDAQEKVQDD